MHSSSCSEPSWPLFGGQHFASRFFIFFFKKGFVIGRPNFHFQYGSSSMDSDRIFLSITSPNFFFNRMGSDLNFESKYPSILATVISLFHRNISVQSSSLSLISVKNSLPVCVPPFSQYQFSF